ncbi:hypothetical protein QVD17_20264 [Tagetes erecta]|uniref:DC1 domain-containing protein n=1 Tax=Tagetes erecta TaxID=13708 RepID=A0AAD8NX56_TARER|nr:hypothetical protein QVD17_20264 [Tagetes erecta]
MDQGYKHFSHLHNLVMHQMPEGVQVSCSGCHSSATGTVYVCWQCNFFLHDQCYRATRSLKHPSHPHHPLTLVPYPTYHSSSYYCNSCQIVGTGFSYSCADCEFDLHVQCAYSISRATSLKNDHLFQELVPTGWNGVHNSVPESLPFTGAHNHYVPSNNISVGQYHSTSQDPSVAHNLAHFSVPTSSQNARAKAEYYTMDYAHPPNTSMPLDGPSGFIPTSSAQYPSIAQTGLSSDPWNQIIPSLQGPSMHQTGRCESISASMDYPSTAQTEPSLSIPTSYPLNPIPSIQDPSTPQTSSHNSTVQYPSLGQTEPSVSIPASAEYPSIAQTGPSGSVQNNSTPSTVPSAQDPSTPHKRPSVSIPTSTINSSPQRPSVAQTGPSVSIPTNYPLNPIASVQDLSTRQNEPTISIPTSSHNSSAQYPSMAQTGPSVSVPTTYPQDPSSSTQDPSTPQNRPSVSIPTSSHASSEQPPSTTQNEPSVSIPTSSHNSTAQAGPSVSIPTNPSDPVTSSHDPAMPQNGLKDQKIMHFSHSHNLSRVILQENDEDEVICSGCEDTIVGNAYSCIEPDCNFHLHESCFDLKKEIHHKSHPEHPLTLLPLSPYNNENGEFTCNACFSDGTGFTYHCSVCKFDLHIQCVSLPETVKRDDHKHMLKLFYSCPVKDEDYTFYCDVCHGEVQKDRWVYYCEQCDYGTHLGCVDCEECERDSIIDTQAQLQRLQLQMEMARQQAQFMASLGSSMANLA